MGISDRGISDTNLNTWLTSIQPVVNINTRYQFVQDIITANANVLTQLNARRAQLGRNPLVWNRYLVLAAHHHATYRAGVTTGGAAQTSNLTVTNSPFGTTRIQWLRYTGYVEAQPGTSTCKSSTHTTEQLFINTYIMDNEWIFATTTQFGCAFIQTPTNRRYVYFVGRDSEDNGLHDSPPPTVTYTNTTSSNTNTLEALASLTLIRYRYPGSETLGAIIN